MSASRDFVRPRDAYRLPRRVEPYADESLPGLLMRTAELYRFHDPTRLLSRLHAPELLPWALCQENPDGELGAAMGSLLGLDDATFRRMSLWTGSETAIRILGTPVWRDLAHHSVRAVCPACLAVSAYHRAIWLVEALPVCAVHGTWLIDRCPAPRCGRRLTWNGVGAHRCGFRGCRFDLRKAETMRADPATLGGIKALHTLMHADEDAASPLGMPRGEALRMAFFIGQIAFGHERKARPEGYIKRHLQEMPAILDAGWQALDNWPNGFHALLERVLARAAEHRKAAGLKGTFGKLSQRVYLWAREPWGAPIGKAFAEFVTASPDMAVSAHMLRRFAPGTYLRHVHVSLGDAEKFLGVSPVTMMTIARTRDMFARPPDGSGVPALLRADRLRELAAEFADFMLPSEAKAALGVGKRLLGQLEAAGMIRQASESERVMESRSYRRSEIEAFLQACVGPARRMSKLQAGDASLSRITRLSAPGRDVPDICRAMIAGRLRAAATVTGRRGLAALRFRLEDVERAVPAVRATMSIVDAAKVLDVHYRHLHVWARKGWLETTTSDDPGERGLRVTEEGLERFRKNYASGRDLKILFDQETSHWLSRHLRYQGVLPISGFELDEGELTLFRRADLTPEVIQAVLRVQAGQPGTGQEKHRAAFAKAERAARAIAATWGADFQRTNNRFTDRRTGRTLQVVSGRRPDLTGVVRFKLNPLSLARLREHEDAWVALVPAQGDSLLLAPAASISWRGGGKDFAYAVQSFDVAGRPLDAPVGAVEVRV